MALSRSFALLALTLCVTQVLAQYQPKCGSTVMYVLNYDGYFNAYYGYDLLTKMASTANFSWYDAGNLGDGPFYTYGGASNPALSVQTLNEVSEHIKEQYFATNTRIMLLISSATYWLTDYDPASTMVAAANRLKSELNVEIFIISYDETRSSVNEWQYKLAQDIASNPLESHVFFYYYDVVSNNYLPAFTGVSSHSFATIGDPYISTMDGNVYSFNGLGEFTLYRADDLIAQVRMAPCDNSNPSSRTCNRAIAIKNLDYDNTLELHYDPVAQYVTVYGDGYILTPDVEINQQYYSYSGFDLEISKFDTPIDSNSIFVASLDFGSTDTFFQISFGNKVGLAVAGVVDIMNFGRIQGLVGTWDGCADNDYYSHNQTYTSPSASSRDIYFNFADTWRVSEAESLFTHGVNAKYYMPYFDELSPSWNPAFSGVEPSANAANDCAFFQNVSPLFYLACMDDVSKGNGDIRPIGYLFTGLVCDAYCNGAPFAFAYVRESYCQSTCAKDNVLDFHYTYNATEWVNSDTYTLNPTSVGATFSATLGGTYTYSLTSDFCPDAAVTGTVQITCDQPPVVSAGDDRVVQKQANWQWPIVVLMGSASDVNNKQLQYSWTFLSWPAPHNDTPGTFPPYSDASPSFNGGERSLTPYFAIQYPGDYVLELSVYDGCFFSKDTVTVHAVCTGCKLHIETSEIADQVYQVSSASGNGWSSSSSRIAYFDYEQSDNLEFQWFIDTNSRGYNFSYPVIGPSTATYDFFVTPAEILINRTENTVVNPTVSTSFSSHTPNGENLFGIDYYRYEGVTHVTTETSVVQTTTTAVELFSSVPIPITMCTIEINNVWGRTATIVVDYDRAANNTDLFTQSPSCVGDYTIRGAARDECNSAHDLTNLHLRCSEQPQVHLVSCKKTIDFDYDNGAFPTVNLDGRDTVDSDNTNLLYQWEIKDPNGQITYYDCSPATERAGTDAYWNCPEANNLQISSVAGTHTVTLRVSDGCTYDYDSTTIDARCDSLTVSATGSDSTQDPGFPANGEFNFTGHFVTAGTPEQEAAVYDQWMLVSAPLGAYDVPVAFWPTDPSGSRNDTASVQVFYGGNYIYMYTANDGCTEASKNVSVTYHCATDDLGSQFQIQPDVLTQTYELGVGYTPVVVTFNINGTNNNANRIYYKARLIAPELSTRVYSVGWTQFLGGANPFTTINPDVPGTYTIEVTVWDNCNVVARNATFQTSCAPAQVPTINNVQSPYTIPSRSSAFVENLQIAETFANYSISWFITNVETNQTMNITGFGRTSVNFTVGTSGSYVVRVYADTVLGCPAETATASFSATCNISLGIQAPTENTLSSIVHGKFSRASISPVFTNVDTAFLPMRTYLYDFTWTFLAAPAGSVFAPTTETTITTTNSTSQTGYVYAGNDTWTRTTTNQSTVTTEVVTTYVTLDYDDTNDAYTGCFAPDVAGSYTLLFSITDYCGHEITQTYTVIASCNTAPDASAGSAATYTFQGTGFSDGTYKYTAIPLNGTASDPEGDFLYYQWSVISQPNNASELITINNDRSKLATFVPKQVGTYVLGFQVTDGCSIKNTTVAITVACPATFQVNSPISFTFDGHTPVALQEFSLMANPQCTRDLSWDITYYNPATAIPPPSVTTEAPKSGASQIAIPAFLVAFLALFVKMF